MESIERSFIAMDAPDHDRYRRMFTKFFSVRRLERLRPVIESVVDELINDILACPPPVDLIVRLGQEVPSRVIGHILGLKLSDRAFFQSRDRVRNTLTSTGEDAQAATYEVLEYVDSVVAAKLEDPGDDLISTLIEEQLGTGELQRSQLVAMIRHLIAAGHDTTTQMIGLSVYTLLTHQGQLAELRADPSLYPNAVEELLRYIPLFQTSPNRVALEDISLSSALIKAGDGVIVPPAAANRDPAAFNSPDAFDIHRKTDGHIAFAFGRHQCLGQNLARIELQIVLRRLFERVPTLQLASDPAELEFSDYLQLSLTELPVTWSPLNASQRQHADRQ